MFRPKYRTDVMIEAEGGLRHVAPDLCLTIASARALSLLLFAAGYPNKIVWGHPLGWGQKAPKTSTSVPYLEFAGEPVVRINAGELAGDPERAGDIIERARLNAQAA